MYILGTPQHTERRDSTRITKALFHGDGSEYGIGIVSNKSSRL